MTRSKHLSLNARKVIGLSLLVLALGVGGCATPVGVGISIPKQVQRNLTTRSDRVDELSASTNKFLTVQILSEKYESQPEVVIAELHKGLPTATEGRSTLRPCRTQLCLCLRERTKIVLPRICNLCIRFSFSQGEGPSDPLVLIHGSVLLWTSITGAWPKPLPTLTGSR